MCGLADLTYICYRTYMRILKKDLEAQVQSLGREVLILRRKADDLKGELRDWERKYRRWAWDAPLKPERERPVDSWREAQVGGLRYLELADLFAALEGFYADVRENGGLVYRVDA